MSQKISPGAGTCQISAMAALSGPAFSNDSLSGPAFSDSSRQLPTGSWQLPTAPDSSRQLLTSRPLSAIPAFGNKEHGTGNRHFPKNMPKMQDSGFFAECPRSIQIDSDRFRSCPNTIWSSKFWSLHPGFWFELTTRSIFLARLLNKKCRTIVTLKPQPSWCKQWDHSCMH
jgi:hypothetical protein